RPQLWLHLFFNRPHAAFCAENHMDVNAEIGASHLCVSSLRDFQSFLATGDFGPRLQIVSSLRDCAMLVPGLLLFDLRDPLWTRLFWFFRVCDLSWVVGTGRKTRGKMCFLIFL